MQLPARSAAAAPVAPQSVAPAPASSPAPVAVAAAPEVEFDEEEEEDDAGEKDDLVDEFKLTTVNSAAGANGGGDGPVPMSLVASMIPPMASLVPQPPPAKVWLASPAL